MRLWKPALLLFAAIAPALAAARPWQGIQPGTSTQEEVLQRFGEPTTKTKRATKTVLAYFGEQALSGTKQAQFHLDAGGIVREITIFLTAQLDSETVEGTYGKPPQRTFVEETFQKVWIYPSSGVTVYFGKDGNVEAITFTPGKAAAAKPSAGAAPQAAAAQ